MDPTNVSYMYSFLNNRGINMATVTPEMLPYVFYREAVSDLQAEIWSIWPGLSIHQDTDALETVIIKRNKLLLARELYKKIPNIPLHQPVVCLSSVEEWCHQVAQKEGYDTAQVKAKYTPFCTVPHPKLRYGVILSDRVLLFIGKAWEQVVDMKIPNIQELYDGRVIETCMNDTQGTILFGSAKEALEQREKYITKIALDTLIAIIPPEVKTLLEIQDSQPEEQTLGSLVQGYGMMGVNKDTLVNCILPRYEPHVTSIPTLNIVLGQFMVD